MSFETLPQPDPESMAASHALLAKIHAEIDASGGWLGFERFMQLALYDPDLGYYSAKSTKFGAGGDFTTAPEISSLFAEALSVWMAQFFAATGANHVLELGAGSGILAQRLIEAFERRGLADVDYSILEPSANLRARQMERFESSRCTIQWLDALPEVPIRGLVLANEVADCLPVVRFVKTGGTVRPLGVVKLEDGLAIVPGEPDARLEDAVRRIERRIGAPLPENYRSELCLLLEPWLKSLFDSIAEGGVLLVDYGMSCRDYYRPERSDGTLICHYRQRAHADPLLWPGLQDLTAWVDFSAVADIAEACSFELAGYTTQAQFLLQSLASDREFASRGLTPEQASAFKTLILPGEMGERFKLIWLSRSPQSITLPGRDFRDWL